MSSTAPGNPATASPSTAAASNLNPQAVQFCNQLVSNTTLQNAYYTTLNTALNEQQYGDQIFDNFFNEQGFPGCTIEDVIAAQQQIAAYNLYYWQAAYDISGSGSSANGQQLTINLDANSNVQVALGQTHIIAWTFQNLVLSWSGGATNATSGQLIFSATPQSDGTFLNGFTGTINGVEVAGAVPTSPSAGATPAQTTPSSSGGSSVMSTVFTVLRIVGQFTFIALNVVNLRKALSNAPKVLAATKSVANATQENITVLEHVPPAQLQEVTASSAGTGTAEPAEPGELPLEGEEEVDPEAIEGNSTAAVEQAAEAAPAPAAAEEGPAEEREGEGAAAEAEAGSESVGKEVLDGVKDAGKVVADAGEEL
jgi:hypothetical protein